MDTQIKYNSLSESKNPMAFSLACLAEIEEIIKIYVKKYPDVSEREVWGLV